MFDDEAKRQLDERGLTLEEAERQLALLGGSPRYTELVRAAVSGDGIERIDAAFQPELIELAEAAAHAGRCIKFVPASGAATRMFRDLLVFERGAGRGTPWPAVLQAAEREEPEARALVRLMQAPRDLPFAGELERELARRGESLEELAERGSYPAVLDALLGGSGLALAERPKGLLPFHTYDEGSRTALEEHVVEAAGYVAGPDGCCRLHFTVSEAEQPRFEALVAERCPPTVEASFSHQAASTDTLAAELDGRPFVRDDGTLLFRPGGHGALIGNLGGLGADLVFLKNIDNVQPDRIKPEVVRWKQILVGHLIRLESEVHELIRRLDETDDPATLDRALAFIRERLHVEATDLDDPAGWARDRLRRPLRVCGMVRNTGEPGGGPFWVRDADGSCTLQIVETSQIDPGVEEQQATLRGATHFNPVDLVCALRDPEGRPYELDRFVDPDTAIVGRKSAEGRELRSLEHPGLWNGAMAGWNTVFVETPPETFSPVKTFEDLLRPEHRA